MARLTDEQVSEYFSKHLPYRYKLLLFHKEICERGPYTGDDRILRASFVASIISGRMFLMFMGVSRDRRVTKLKRYKSQPSDVTCKDLGGRLIDLDKLNEQDTILLYKFLEMVDRTTAHLTEPFDSDWPNTHSAIDKIVQLLHENLYSITGRKFSVHPEPPPRTN